jgi:hypothetical protein
MTDFTKVSSRLGLLEQAKVPCNVKLFKNCGSISVECGFNWPDEMFDQIADVAEAVDVPVSVCASVDGGILIDQQQIAGGPKTYFPYNITF